MGAIEPFMPRPRTEDKRKRILEAAVKVFARKGYFAARVSEIARKAGVADGTIYLYFRSKEDILVKLFDEMVTSWIIGGKGYDLGQLATPVVDLFLRGAAAPGRVARARPALAAAAPGRGGK